MHHRALGRGRQMGVAQRLPGNLEVAAANIGLDRGEVNLRIRARPIHDIRLAVGRDLHRALQARDGILQSADLFRRTRIGGEPQLQMAGVEDAGRVTVDAADGGLSAAGGELAGGQFHERRVVSQVAGETVVRFVAQHAANELEIGLHARIPHRAGNHRRPRRPAFDGDVFQGEQLRQFIHRSAAQRAAGGQRAGIAGLPIHQLQRHLKLRVQRPVRHGAVAHGHAGGRNLGIAFDGIEILTLVGDAGRAQVAGDPRLATAPLTEPSKITVPVSSAGRLAARSPMAGSRSSRLRVSRWTCSCRPENAREIHFRSRQGDAGISQVEGLVARRIRGGHLSVDGSAVAGGRERQVGLRAQRPKPARNDPCDGHRAGRQGVPQQVFRAVHGHYRAAIDAGRGSVAE